MRELHDNFFNLNEDLQDSIFKEELTRLREDYKKEISGSGGGCSACRLNAIKKKYGRLVQEILERHD